MGLQGSRACEIGAFKVLLKGSWDLVNRVIIRVTILITTYNPN